MIITDLNYLEVVTEETNIEGGNRRCYKKPGYAEAFADANALAIGRMTFSSTYTDAVAVAGVSSQSYSSSAAIAST